MKYELISHPYDPNGYTDDEDIKMRWLIFECIMNMGVISAVDSEGIYYNITGATSKNALYL